MSIELSARTKPAKLMAAVMPDEKTLLLGAYDIDTLDLCLVVEWWLTRSDLTDDDPRRVFFERLHRSSIVEGWNKGGERIKIAQGVCSYTER